ncbi:MAG: hypothetical protein EOO20_18505 [Chryseobacterium sp.]|nr:MAG: hypothetical protein EOO20_18505 [Chryseobacterium sp.]
MKRLIIVGNGFDLAHGMKTSYSDFILWCVRKIFLQTNPNSTTLHPLMTVEQGSYFDTRVEQFSFDDFLTFYHDSDHALSHRPYSFRIPNSFMKRVILHCRDCRWVDIETEFYDELKRIQRIEANHKKEKELNDLNEAFAVLQVLLEEYLLTLPTVSINPEFTDRFQENFQDTDFLPDAKFEPVPESILVLSFNYTELVSKVDGVGKIKVTHIHGQLASEKNPMIFGFGDELDDSYKPFELEKARGFFRYIKSFGYFQANHYRDLVRFIESDEYQVDVVGHSCGLSDRTMLNMIFEHKNCKSVRLFYYRNFRNLVEDISRHFTDKQRMRRLIVPYERSIPMPQVAGEPHELQLNILG